MLDLLRKHIVIITGVALGWSGYSFSSGGDGKPEALAKSEMEAIGAAFLSVRDPSVALEISGDPYRLVLPPESGAVAGAAAGAGASGANGRAGAPTAASTPAAKAATAADAWLGVLREARGLYGEWGREPGSATGAGAAQAALAPRSNASFLIVLQSTLGTRTGGQARICGRTVQQGETMPFLDPVDPPLLLRVEGTGIVVAHAGSEYALDLAGQSSLQVGAPASNQPQAAASSKSATTGGSGSSAAKPAKQAGAKSAAAAPAAGAPKKKGAYRVRGSSTKK